VDHQPFRLALLQNRQGLVGVDIARHAVFHVVVGKGVKLNAGFRRMNAGLPVHADRLPAEAFSHGNPRFAPDNGRRVVVWKNRPVGDDFGVDRNGTQMGRFQTVKRGPQSGQVILRNIFEQRQIQSIQLVFVNADDERHRTIADHPAGFDPENQAPAGHVFKPCRSVRDSGLQAQGQLLRRIRFGRHFQKKRRILFGKKLLQNFQFDAVWCRGVAARHRFEPVAQSFVDIIHFPGIIYLSSSCYR